MPVESWITPDDTPALAMRATARIDAVLARLTGAERDAFWASVRKCYNTPYNDPAPRALPTAPVLAPAPEASVAGLDRAMPDMPMAAMRGPGLGAETHVS